MDRLRRINTYLPSMPLPVHSCSSVGIRGPKPCSLAANLLPERHGDMQNIMIVAIHCTAPAAITRCLIGNLFQNFSSLHVPMTELLAAPPAMEREKHFIRSKTSCRILFE